MHESLTGPAARRGGDANPKLSMLHDVWNALGLAWEDLEGLRQLGSGDFMKPEEVQRFVNGWQVRVRRIPFRSASNSQLL